MQWLRRILLELSALLVVSGVLGFLGPFGTYLNGDLVSRSVNWSMLMFGAYATARPVMELWRWMARKIHLPQAPLVFWGMMLFGVPIAFLWKASGAPEANLIGGYASIFSFSVLCSLLVMIVAWWAERTEVSLRPGGDWSAEAATFDQALRGLRARLSPGFVGDILALESEDHYVRVYGARGSELLLIRLRDAIAEMDGTPGEQTHRSWWVARDAIDGVHARGRNLEIKLVTGERALVARDSIERLTASGFLPA